MSDQPTIRMPRFTRLCLALIACQLVATSWVPAHAASHAGAAHCVACHAGQPAIDPDPPALRPPVFRAVGVVAAGAARPARATAVVPTGRGPPGGV